MPVINLKNLNNLRVFLLGLSVSAMVFLPAAFSQNATDPTEDSAEKVPPPAVDTMPLKSITLMFSEAADLLDGLNELKSPAGQVSLGDKSNEIILMDAPQEILEMEKFIKEADVQRFTMVFELSYAKASQLSEKVKEIITKNIGKVKFDERSNKLVVTDTAAKIDDVRKLVDSFDQRDRQVLLDFKLMKIILNDEHRLGVDWEAIVSDYHGLALKNTAAPEGSKNWKISAGTLSKDDYKVLLEALDTVGSVNVSLNTVITTVNNREVRLAAGQSQPYFLTVDMPRAPGAADTQSLDVEVKLFVTPTAHSDGTTTLKIRAESAALSSKGPIDQGTTPVGAADAAGTELSVNVKEGTVIVIGGLIQEEKIKVLKKVPILGDVPLLGVAFRTHGRSVKRTETVIFLNPKAALADPEESKIRGN